MMFNNLMLNVMICVGAFVIARIIVFIGFVLGAFSNMMVEKVDKWIESKQENKK